jgi:hypothetical protein
VIVKVTLLMQATTALSRPNFPLHRVGGWSESYYYDGPGGTDLFARVTGQGLRRGSTSLCDARARLLAGGAAIVGQRYQFVDPVGRTQTGAAQFPGWAGVLNDIPQMALLCKIATVNGLKQRLLILRGIPDSLVVEGEYNPVPIYDLALDRFFRVLAAFSMKQNSAGRPVTVNNITSEGLVTLRVPRSTTLEVGMTIIITDAQPAAGRPVTGAFVVESLGPLANQFKLVGWPYGAATGGTAQRRTYVYPLFDNESASVSRIISRKVGRPSVGYVGRHSNRR